MWNFMSCLNDASLRNWTDISIGIMEKEAVQKGATQSDLEIARNTGFHPLDIRALRAFTTEHKILLIFRCPKPDSRAFIGLLPAKMQAIKHKTNDVGLVSAPRRAQDQTRSPEKWFVSDYDLMSVYKINANGGLAKKIFFSGTDPNNSRSPLSQQATELCSKLNHRLINKIQHGAQDDWQSKTNRGVKMLDDRYLAAMLGDIRPLGNGHTTRLFYKEYHLIWPYDDLGRYKTPAPNKV